MLAARWHGQRDIRVEDVPDPGEPGPGQVRVRIEACGICGTDIEEYTHGPNIIPTSPHPLTGTQAPIVLGHEPAGRIESVGDGVDLAPGTLVAIEGNLFCGECWHCARGEYTLCPKQAALGLMLDGGLAEFVVAPAYMCIPFDSDIPAEHAALAEPLSVAVRAVGRGGIGPGTTVGIVGCGTIGLLLIQAARIAGASRVVAIDKLESRLQIAVRLGADLAVTPAQGPEAAFDLTGGLGLDVTMEAAGNPAAAAAAVRLARKGGRTVLLGVFGGEVAFDMMDLLLGEKTVLASLSHIYDSDFTTAVSLLDRREVDVDPIVTDRIPLSDVVGGGFEALLSEPDSHLKISVLPGR
ncbi:MAG TPA: alcohol dehydrogenase catalytic domain-containing protein [Nitriliruptorales bacterium]